ncbi:MAG TPA: 3-deoxy-D-manno-octulosonic acid transferase [Acidobacteriaceae bacterium]|nr:3-deoxy-D-manno-octulosonic acid transferase [Acidobacteriaceae bacterium]
MWHRISLTMLLYSLGLLAAILAASPYWLLRMLWSGRYRDGLGQRLGAVRPELRAFVAERRTIWVHAVSVGETMAIGRLIELLDGMDRELPVVISTTTRTGQKLAQERFHNMASMGAGQVRVFYWPLDFGWMVRRYLRALRPRAIVLVESELWPRMIFEATRAGVPTIVVNGRISDRSLPRYLALRRLWRRFLRKLTMVLAQSEEDRKRFAAIGVPAEKVRVGGNLKFDARAATESAVTRELRDHLPAGAKVLVAGSTLEGEEIPVLDAFRALLEQLPELVLILAPRHPERFAAVANLIQEKQFACVCRSTWMPAPEPLAAASVFLLDSVGELASVYSLGSVAFVGGSLVNAGGHNPLEPAQFSVPIVMGPSLDNFRSVTTALLKAQAMRIAPEEALAATLAELLTSADAVQMGLRARDVFEQEAGASERCFEAIRGILLQSAEPGTHQANPL